MKTSEYMDKTETNVLHTYNRVPIVLERGKGVHLYDTDGKEYLDFAAGIAVSVLGYKNQVFIDALKDQMDKLIHTSNLYFNTAMGEAAEKLVSISGMDCAFFTNSGTEAIEGAIKAAKKYAYLRDKNTDHEIIAMNHSFHGRSMGSLSVTGNDYYREPFKPLIAGVHFADFNDLDSVRSAMTDKTCAVILETVQGEGGIYPASEDFLVGVRKLCDEHDILLILDEIQCGMGRTGYMFAWQGYGVKPDIMTLAKGLGGGFPVGAFLLNQKTAKSSLVPGDHGTTYGGSPLACRAVSSVVDILNNENLVNHVRELTPYLEERLDELVDEFDFVDKRRGKGFMQGLVLDGIYVEQVIEAAAKNRLLVISAAGNVLRLVPPLVITKEDIDDMAKKLKVSLTDVMKAQDKDSFT
ncbi:aspartate aminotransferase family protein [Blautia liquoris]|uniref:Acetylornithine aminotransferase n=1 Tax=Blautia liquoris TaxID=2779518 RepID=A0A7M2RED9_9FIRM|nr:aspartate aminotransferase family protein [Blautia liquoris]QOV18351.1 aspartate aminotransferase family protein [Blautia liquoris]